MKHTNYFNYDKKAEVRKLKAKHIREREREKYMYIKKIKTEIIAENLTSKQTKYHLSLNFS